MAEELETLQVKLRDEDDALITLAEGDTLVLAVKPAGLRDTSLLTIAGDLTQDETTKLITLPLNAWTEAVAILAAVTDANPDNDIVELLCDFSLTYTPSGGMPRQSFFAPVTIEIPVALPTDGTPDAVPDASTKYVRADVEQTFSDPQKAQARANIGAGSGLLITDGVTSTVYQIVINNGVIGIEEV
jgi:hypothetical protein